MKWNEILIKILISYIFSFLATYSEDMSNSKSKRTVTVEKSLIGDNNDKAKPSVFARLGPGVQPRKSPSSFDVSLIIIIIIIND